MSYLDKAIESGAISVDSQSIIIHGMDFTRKELEIFIEVASDCLKKYDDLYSDNWFYAMRESDMNRLNNIKTKKEL